MPFLKAKIANQQRMMLLIILLAIALRVLGIWHGWPDSYYHDEITFVKRSLAFGSWDLNPHWFHKPAFLMYLLFFEYGLFFLIGKIIGIWNSVSEFAVHYIKNPGIFYLIGRATVVIFSVGTIAAVYKIGERYFKRNAGLFAALLVTLSYGHIAASQDVKADIPASFFGILSMLFLLKYLKDKKVIYVLLSAAFAGIGTSTKYYAIVMLVPIIFAIIEAHRNVSETFVEKFRKVLFFWLAAVSVFMIFCFISAPYNFIDPLGLKSTFGSVEKLYWKIVGSIIGGERVRDQFHFISSGLGYFDASVDYIRIIISKFGMGILIGCISIAGIISLLFQSIKHRFIFLLYPFVFTLVAIFVNPGYSHIRHQTPIYPYLAIAGGVLIVTLAGKTRIRKIAVYSIVLLLLLHPLYHIIARGLIISRSDTRIISKKWIEKNIPAGTKLLIDQDAPRLLESEKSLQKQMEPVSDLKKIVEDSSGQFTSHYEKYLKYKRMAARDNITYDITEFRLPWWREYFLMDGAFHLTTEYDMDMGNPLRLHGVHSYDYYVENGYEYAVVNASRLEVYEKNEDKYPYFVKFYRELFRRAVLIKEFSPLEGERRPGPPIRIYQINKPSENTR